MCHVPVVYVCESVYLSIYLILIVISSSYVSSPVHTYRPTIRTDK